MRTLRSLALLGAFLTALGTAAAQGFAPANLANTVFNGTLESATGGRNALGTFSLLFTGAGRSHNLSLTGEPLPNPVPYTYTRTGDTTATLVEPATDGQPGVSVALTFTSATAGNFVATYTGGGTQTGSFTLGRIPAPAPLANMSSRVRLSADGPSISGIVIGGEVPRRVLIRAIGPGLSQFGVTNPATDPRMTLFRGSEAIGQNNNWGTGTEGLAAAFTSVGAFALTTGSNDSAVVSTLNPGAYTAHVVGAPGDAGREVLLEVYYLD